MNFDFKIKKPFKQNKNVPTQQEKKQFKMWSAFTILLLIIVFIILVSWILKWSGVRITEDNESKNITALGIFDLFLAPIHGFVSGAEIIVFLVALGVFLNIVICSKTLEGFSQNITAKLKGREIWAIIPLMVFF